MADTFVDEPRSELSDRRSMFNTLANDQTLGYRWLPWVLQAVIALFVFLNLRPDLVVSNTQPVGADFVVHNAAIDLINHHLWDHGLLSGWSWWWSAGFPAFRFYMPLPLFVAWIVGWAFPTAIALKLVAVLPLVAFPFVVSRFVRTLGYGLLVQTTASLATVLFLFESHQHVFGGNVASTLIGEYPYEWGMLCVLLALSAFWSDLEAGRRGARTGVLIGLAALFHPIGGIWAIIGCVVIALARPLNQRRRTMRHGLRSMLVATSLAAFWYLPFLWYGEYSITTTFEKRTDYAAMLLPYSSAVETTLWILAGIGVLSVVRRRDRRSLVLLTLWALGLLAVLALPKSAVANSRMVPYALLFRMVFVGIGAATVLGVALVLWRRPHPSAPRVAIAVSVLCVLSMVSYNLATLPFGHRTTERLGGITVAKDYRWLIGPKRSVSSWSQYPSVALAGLEQIPKYPELLQLVSDLGKVEKKYGCGRIAYEFDKDGVFGSPYVFQLLPQLTHGCFSVVNGLISGSPTSDLQFIGETAWSFAGERYYQGLPYGTLDLKKARAHFHELGVRYYLAFSPFAVLAAQDDPALTRIATSGSTYIFGIDDAAVVQPLSQLPVVDSSLTDATAWTVAAHDYFQRANPDAVRFAADGPTSWPRGRWTTTRTGTATPAVQVGNFAGGADWLAFDVSRPGTPILVRVTYFPTWDAQGADGPYRVAPNWMVVVPRSNHVRLVNNTTFIEAGSSLVTLGGIGASIWLGIRTRRTRRIGRPSAQ